MEELFEEFMNEHLSKISIGVGIAYAGVMTAMAIDLVSGVMKARKMHIARTSKGYKMTAAKAQKYFSPMLCLTVIDIILCFYLPIPAFTLLWACYCGFCEFKSIMEKSWRKAEIREAANTMNVIIRNKEDLAKALCEILKEKKDE